MTKKEMEKNISEVWALFRETDKKFQETDRKFQDTDKKFQETDRRQKKTDRQIKNLGKQIGGLGRKFGGFTEGMAYPSMKRILKERFGMGIVSPNVDARKNGEAMELDVLTYGNGGIEAAYIVEVKSRVRNEEAIQSLFDKLRDFPKFFPELKEKALFGILAVVDISTNMKKMVLDAGLYLALIKDDTFSIDVPEKFQPKRFN